MQKSPITLAMLATAAVLPFAAQTASADTATPRFEVLPMHGAGKQYVHQPAALTTWNGSFKYEGTTHKYIMAGTNPASTNTTTTFTVYVIPVKMVYGQSNGNMTFDPNVDQANGVSITQNLLNSPLFNSLNWKFGKVANKDTQYEDAYQRSSFWGSVGKKNTAYHILLSPSTLSEETINVSSSQGSVMNNPFGSGVVGTMSINAFDEDLQGFIKGQSQVNPTNLPLFITDNIYLTSGGCCIGGYHSAEGNGQTYSYATYVTSPGAFSEDIDAFSHELGEWIADPFTNNRGYCGGLLEVGDPIEVKTDYGTFPVTYNGVTWHPQNLVFISYFGAPAKKSANGWLDTGHLETSVCQNGQ
jgi:hypothetical protein